MDRIPLLLHLEGQVPFSDLVPGNQQALGRRYPFSSICFYQFCRAARQMLQAARRELMGNYRIHYMHARSDRHSCCGASIKETRLYKPFSLHESRFHVIAAARNGSANGRWRQQALLIGEEAGPNLASTPCHRAYHYLSLPLPLCFGIAGAPCEAGRRRRRRQHACTPRQRRTK
jgi:hypothetical protein